MKKKGMKRILAYVLTLCMMVTGLFVADYSVVQAEEAAETTTVYFYNSDAWNEVGIHAWGASGDLTGGWGSTLMTASTALGDGWFEAEIASAPSFSLIIFNKEADTERITGDVVDAANVYFSMKGRFASAEAAEASLEAQPTTVYFYNSDSWEAVTAHAYGDGFTTAWPGVAAEEATELGENWWKATIEWDASMTPFNVIFNNNGNGSQKADTYITKTNGNYVIGNGAVYLSQAMAEVKLGIEEGTMVYFYNSAEWATVGAHAYSGSAALLGDWGTVTAYSSDIGENWVELPVPAAAGFNVIFFNTAADADRAEIVYSNATNVYGNLLAGVYDSKEAAEEAWNNAITTVYFLNNKGWENVYAYAAVDGEPVGDMVEPGVAAEVAALGDNWYQVSIPQNASVNPFDIVFSDGADNSIEAVEITNYKDNYVTGNGEWFATQVAAENSVGIVSETVVYYLNSYGWEEIAAYTYGGAAQDILGGWPGTDVEAAPELGEMWVKVSVPAKPSFSIIFHDKSDTTESIRAEIGISNENMVYVVGCKAEGTVGVYGSAAEAEVAMGLGDPSMTTTVYFYNSRGWGDINCYVFREEEGENVTVGSGWPGSAAEEATELGENWWKYVVPRVASEESPFYLVFNDGVQQTDEDILIDDTVNVYVTAACGTYPTAEEAEAAAANDTYDDGCEEGPNADIENYGVEFDGAGAVLPYVAYEAEDAETNASVLEYATAYRETIQSEASGRQAVKLEEMGDYVEFTLTEATNSLVLRYAMPDDAAGTGIDATLSMYVGEEEAQDLALTSKHAWVYGGYPFDNIVGNGKAHRFFDEIRLLLDETLPAGTTIRLQKDEADTAEYYVIDFVECEVVDAPLTQPEGSLSVVDFGAVANDGQDDREAFEACLEAAQEQDKEVWIPAGNFDLVEEKAFEVKGVTIRGAGMWHTNLNGAGAAFKFEGTCKFYDFAMTGVTCVRDDSGDLAGFENGGGHATNVTIQNIWMEHMKVGVWTANTERMAIQGCRIRNTYADGINLCSGTNDSVVRNNSMRNTGDDCIAIWPWNGDCSGNTIAHNTIQVPTLANGVAIYGGGKNVVDGNHIMDTINNGSGITVSGEFGIADGYTGKTTVKNNLLERCGSMQTDENYAIGAIWIWASYNAMTKGINVYNNVLTDCPQVGITIECNANLTDLNIQHNTIDGATDAIFEYLNGTGSGKVGNMTVNNITGEYINDDNPNFTLTEVDEDIIDDEPIENPFGDVEEGEWFYPYVMFAYKYNLMGGKGTMDDGSLKFDPANTITRAEFVQMLYSKEGKPAVEYVDTFTDVAADKWYTDAILWAAEEEIVGGKKADFFDVNGMITRQEIALILYKYALYNDYNTEGLVNADFSGFADAAKISTWAENGMKWAVQYNVIGGKNVAGETLLSPGGNATRAEAATMMKAFMGAYEGITE